MSSKLVDLREKLAAKQAQLAAIFQAYPDLNMPAEVADDIKQRNTELTDLGKDYDRLRELDEIGQAARKANEHFNAPKSGLILPGAPAKEQEGKEAHRLQVQKSIGALFAAHDAYK
ncbi:MAG TPA: hypothetical protein VGW38_20405, partial [Chloroflexota bacterium]|nr:hypothetical protein [Chloroflexota bacterium]